MGANNGTGCPNWLRCWRCRRAGTFERQERRGFNLEATGRTRPRPRGHHGARQTRRFIQYHCKECGFTGWTNHMDGERLLAAWAGRCTE